MAELQLVKHIQNDFTREHITRINVLLSINIHTLSYKSITGFPSPKHYFS